VAHGGPLWDADTRLGEHMEGSNEIGVGPAVDLGQRNFPLPGHDGFQALRGFAREGRAGEVDEEAVEPAADEIGVGVLPFFLVEKASTKGVRMVLAYSSAAAPATSFPPRSHGRCRATFSVVIGMGPFSSRKVHSRTE
jgi:hypothetical protein